MTIIIAKYRITSYY